MHNAKEPRGILQSGNELNFGAMMQAQFAISYPLSVTGMKAAWISSGLRKNMMSAATALWLSRRSIRFV